MKLLLHIAATAGALLLIAQYVSGIEITGLYSALWVAVLWGVVSITVRPVLGLLTLPINLISFGLFSFVLNALLFWLLSSFVEGFAVAGFVPALIGSAILSAVSWLLHRFL